MRVKDLEFRRQAPIVRDGYRTFQVVSFGAPDVQPPVVPRLEDRRLLDGQPAAYICRNFACQAPMTKAEGLQAQSQER